MPEPPQSCLECGACCFSPSAEFVRVTGADWARLGVDAERLAHFVGHRAFMKMRDRHCAALERRATTAGGAEFFCTIYDRRPEVCRTLERGSPHCEAERETKAAWRDSGGE